MKSEKRPRGRPPGPSDKRRTAELRIRLTPDEREKMDRAATAHGEDTSTWARARLLSLAGKTDW